MARCGCCSTETGAEAYAVTGMLLGYGIWNLQVHSDWACVRCHISRFVQELHIYWHIGCIGQKVCNAIVAQSAEVVTTLGIEPSSPIHCVPPSSGASDDDEMEKWVEL